MKSLGARIGGCCLLAAAVLLLPAAPLAAEGTAPTGNFSTTIASAHIWRGYELSRNSIVIQPSATVGYRGFSANFWGNLDTKPYDPSGTKSYASRWNETDLTLSYAKDLGPVTVGGGYIYVSLGALNADGEDRPDSQDLFVSVTGNTLLSPTLIIYKEIAHYRNWYFLLGVSHTFEFSKAISLKVAATASYLLSTDETTYPEFDGDALATSNKFSNFHDATLSTSLSIKVTDNITLTPVLTYIFPLTGAARNEMRGYGLKGAYLPSERDGNYLVGGITASFSF